MQYTLEFNCIFDYYIIVQICYKINCYLKFFKKLVRIMIVSAVICEFNPFHNGHLYLINKMREQGSTHVVAVMSGNYTQRGDPAIISKQMRARTAIECGADLVAELPVPFAVSSAEKFASAGVSIIDGMGCVDNLYFGAECAEQDMLTKICAVLNKDETVSLVKDEMKRGVTYAVAVGDVVQSFLGRNAADELRKPNNILAVEYIKALSRMNSKVKPVPIQRISVDHDSTSANENMASASYIRNCILSGEDISKFVPGECMRIITEEIRQSRCPVTAKAFERELFIRLRGMTSEQLKNIAEVGEGIENKILSSANNFCSYNDLLNNVKSKRYTHARIRRILLYALLGIDKKLQSRMPEYIKVIGFNKRGAQVLKRIKSEGKLPIITKISEQKRITKQSQLTLLAKEKEADNIYNALMPTINPSVWVSAFVIDD